jgi:hypothetical protein
MTVHLDAKLPALPWSTFGQNGLLPQRGAAGRMADRLSVSLRLLMNEQSPRSNWNSNWGKLGLAAGAVACVLSIPLFGITLPALPALEQTVLTVLFIASMATCSIMSAWRPLLGMLVLPPVFFGLSCLACWWVVSR